MTTIVGIDPGLVHTGVVAMTFADGELLVEHAVFSGGGAGAVATWVYALKHRVRHVFIEAYRPRGNSYGTDPKMRDLMVDFRKYLPGAKVLDNTGVKQVIGTELMQRCGVWSFTTPTHHQDLRSAARIALYGVVKDEGLNELLYEHLINQLTSKKETA